MPNDQNPSNLKAIAALWCSTTGLLTPEEWEVLLAPLPAERLSRTDLSRLFIMSSVMQYRSRHHARSHPQLKEHRRQFERLLRAARDLKIAVSNISCSPLVLYSVDEKEFSADSVKVSANRASLLKLLDHMIYLSDRAVSDQSFFKKTIRGEDEDSSGHQAVENRILWSTLFEIWLDLNGELTYSENGPLHRFVEKIQVVAAGGPPLNSEALKKAVQRWKRKKKQGVSSGRSDTTYSLASPAAVR